LPTGGGKAAPPFFSEIPGPNNPLPTLAPIIPGSGVVFPPVRCMPRFCFLLCKKNKRPRTIKPMRTANPTNNPTTLPVLEKKDFEFSCAEGLGGSTDWFEVGTAVTVVTLPSDVVTVLIIADEVFEG